MDSARVIADLRELDRRTGGRRVCWTPVWEEARAYLRSLLPVEATVDRAGNLWAVVPGESDEVVALGSHIDCVPDGGWLDGALGVMAAVEVLRSLSSPLRTVALVDWADEEGARFGRSLLGSSAFAGTLDPDAVRDLLDADGVRLEDALASHGVSADDMASAGEGRSLAAYLELHIEQGPVLEAEGLRCGAVLGTFGMERHRVIFQGRTGHAGSTPMDRRADAGVAAARVIAGLQKIAVRHGGVCTAGRLDLSPGIVTAVPGRAELLVDQRALDPSALAAMLADARELWSSAAAGEGCTVAVEPIFSIDPVPFHPGLVGAAADACGAVAGSDRRLPSGALHDASELARIVPTAMIFASSRDGVSHSRAEDTSEADLTAAIEAFGALAERVIAEGVPG